MFTLDELTKVIRYDAGTGDFFWQERTPKPSQNKSKVATWNARYAGKIAGVKTHGYVKISVFNQKFYAHRLAWFITYGEWPKGIIDHIDTDGQNNRITNLRDVTKVENGRNLRKPRKSKTGMPGVYVMPNGKFRSQRKLGDKAVHLGVFDTAEEARQAFLGAL